MKNKNKKPTISKDLFFETIDIIKRQMIIDDEYCDSLSKVFPDSFIRGYDNNLIINQLVKMLKFATNDTENIEYFIYELDFGKNWTIDSVTDENGKHIKMKTVNQLWSYLCKNYNSKQ